MSEDLIAYDAEQHARISRAVLAAERRELGRPGIKPKGNAFRPPVRVICMQNRAYDSTTVSRVPAFVCDPDRVVYTVEQVGSTLSGYLALTINGVRYVVECRRSSFSDIVVPGLRITVLPGLWEFDFGERTDNQADQITVTVERITNDENTSICELFDDLDSAVYTGTVIVRRESWVTVQDEDSEDSLPITFTSIRDVIPYSTGTVPAGAIGEAYWGYDSGYRVAAWQCRTFSHATGYDQATDPLILESTGGGSGGGGGGGGGGGPGTAQWQWSELMNDWALVSNSCSPGYVPDTPGFIGLTDGQLADISCVLP